MAAPASLILDTPPLVDDIPAVWEGSGGGDAPDLDPFLGTNCCERSSRHLEFQLSHEQVLVNLP